MPNVLVDYVGHSDLYHSLHILFEKRLGYRVFCPCPVDEEEWIKRGFAEFVPRVPMEGIGSECDKHRMANGVHYYHRMMEPNKGRYIQRGITFEKFLEMDFDIVLTTYYAHEERFRNLVAKHKPKAKFIRQINNIHEKPLGFCKNILFGPIYHPNDYSNPPSQELAFARLGMNYIQYFPEQYSGYHYTRPTNHRLVMNLASISMPEDIEAWNTMGAALKDSGFIFTSNSLNHNGTISPPPVIVKDFVPHLQLPQAIKESGFVWYTKAHGGGGFTVRQAMACGRPVIVRKRYSAIHIPIEDKIFKHGVNCIDLDVVGNDVSLIKAWGEPSRHAKVCRLVKKEFDKDMRFADKAEEIRQWLEKLPKGVS